MTAISQSKLNPNEPRRSFLLTDKGYALCHALQSAWRSPLSQDCEERSQLESRMLSNGLCICSHPRLSGPVFLQLHACKKACHRHRTKHIMSKNNGTRINQVKHQGNFVILNLSCGHTLKKRLGWWQRNFDDHVRFAHCPQCKGYK